MINMIIIITIMIILGKTNQVSQQRTKQGADYLRRGWSSAEDGKDDVHDDFQLVDHLDHGEGGNVDDVMTMMLTMAVMMKNKII